MPRSEGRGGPSARGNWQEGGKGTSCQRELTKGGWWYPEVRASRKFEAWEKRRRIVKMMMVYEKRRGSVVRSCCGVGYG